MRKLFLVGLLGLLACTDELTPGGLGSLRVHLVEGLGGFPDTNGYTVAGTAFATTFVPGDTVRVVEDLEPGDMTVSISGMVSWCRPVATSQLVTIVSGETTDVWFILDCPRPFGVVQVITSAVGLDLDPNSYRLLSEAGEMRSEVNDTTYLQLPALEESEVALRDIARSCWLRSDSTATVAPPLTGDTITVTFEADCGVLLIHAFMPVGAARFQLVNVTSGEIRAGGEFHIAASGLRQSPNGERVVMSGWLFADGNEQLFTTRPDGTDIQQLTQTSVAEGRADWSEGGGALVLERYDLLQLHRLDLSTGVATPIPGRTGPERGPDVRPQDDVIAYENDASGSGWSNVWLMDIDGSGRHAAFTDTLFLFGPAWSPAGDRLALSGAPNNATTWFGIYVGTPGSAAPTLITAPVAGDCHVSPRWSGDGEWLVFANSCGGGRHRFYLVRPDGSNLRQIPFPYDTNSEFTWLR